MYGALQQEPTYIDENYFDFKRTNRNDIQPTLFLISIPFRGIYIVLLDQRNGLKIPSKLKLQWEFS
jgi:hypothetical protein